jgi:hypothetical protein
LGGGKSEIINPKSEICCHPTPESYGGKAAKLSVPPHSGAGQNTEFWVNAIRPYTFTYTYTFFIDKTP